MSRNVGGPKKKSKLEEKGREYAPRRLGCLPRYRFCPIGDVFHCEPPAVMLRATLIKIM